MKTKQYVVSDENGYYIEYTTSRQDAINMIDDANVELADQDIDGRYALGVLVNGSYQFSE